MNLVIISSDENLEIQDLKNISDKKQSDLKTKTLIEKYILLTKDRNMKKIFYISYGSQLKLNSACSDKYIDLPFYAFECSEPSSIQNLLLLAPYFKNETICLINGDLLINKNTFDDFLTFSSLQKDVDGVIAIKKNSLDDNQKGVSMDNDGYVIKLSDSNCGYNWTTASLYYFYPNFLDELEWALDLGISRFNTFLRFLIAQKQMLKVYSI